MYTCTHIQKSELVHCTSSINLQSFLFNSESSGIDTGYISFIIEDPGTDSGEGKLEKSNFVCP